MINYVYININDKLKKQKVYRVLSVTRFLDMLLNKKMTFVKPELWDDPYENFFFKQEFTSGDGKKFSLDNFGTDLYGNCWTLNSDFDFSWKVYAPAKNGVQISTTIEKIYNHFKYIKKDNNLHSFQVGAVDYKKWEEIKKDYECRTKLDLIKDLLSNFSLFQKREEFIHEKEIRITIRYLHNTGNLLRLNIIPNDFIDSVLLDPRLNNDEAELYRELIIQQGFNGKIEKSNLYSIPKLKLIFDNITVNTKKKSNKRPL